MLYPGRLARGGVLVIALTVVAAFWLGGLVIALALCKEASKGNDVEGSSAAFDGCTNPDPARRG